MGTIKNYRDLEVWQKAMDLAVECYKVTQHFPKTESYGLASQIQRASASIAGNIAEGRSRQHVKEFLHHLSIAYGSLAEVETFVLLAQRLAYINGDTCDRLLADTAQIGRMLNGLRKSLTSLPDTRHLTPDT